MNRQVRRMTQAAGHKTLRLVRVGIGRLRAEDLALRPGEWRAVARADILAPEDEVAEQARAVHSQGDARAREDLGAPPRRSAPGPAAERGPCGWRTSPAARTSPGLTPGVRSGITDR